MSLNDKAAQALRPAFFLQIADSSHRHLWVTLALWPGNITQFAAGTTLTSSPPRKKMEVMLAFFFAWRGCDSLGVRVAKAGQEALLLVLLM